MTARLRRARRDTSGFTLVELLVAMTILTIFFAIFSTLIVKVFDTTQRQQRRSTASDIGRNVVQVLDRQVRYASAVMVPYALSDGTQRVEWQVASATGAPTCYQWQLTPTGFLQWRTWRPAPSTGYTNLKPWSTAGYDISRSNGKDVFSLSDGASTSSQFRQQLTVRFKAGAGNGKDGSPTLVTFTALNSPNASGPAIPLCKESVPS